MIFKYFLIYLSEFHQNQNFMNPKNVSKQLDNLKTNKRIDPNLHSP